MRIIRHEDSEKAGGGVGLASGIFLVIKFPVLLLRERFFFSVMVRRDLRVNSSGNHVSPGRWIRVLNNVIIVFIISIITLVFMSGVVFILYLFKNFLGLDLFPFEHLL